MALVTCRVLMIDNMTEETFIVDGFFESNSVEFAHKHVDDNGIKREDMTCITLKGGHCHTIEMSLNQVIDYCQSIPFSYN